MKFNRRNAIVAASALFLGAAHSAGVTDTEIVIGTHIDLSGPAAIGMPPLRNSMQMRIDEVNAAGGIHGRKIRLIIEDNASAPQQAVRAVQKLIKSDGVFAILNPFGSGPNAATVKMATDAGVVVFAPWGASAIIQKVSGNSPLLFTTVQNYDSTTATALSWAVKNWKTSKVGVIYQEGPFGDLVRAGISQSLKDGGFAVAAEAAYKAGDIDFSSQVAKMKAANVDLIVAGTVTRETLGVMSEVKKLNWSQVKVLTTIPGRSTVVANLGKDSVEGLYGIGGWRLHSADSTDPAVARFFSAYKQRFNVDADENSANGYSYTSWFIAGLQAAGRNLTTESLVSALKASRHQDFTTFAAQSFVNNHVGPELASIDQIRGGKWVQVMAPAGR
jgi:ABC-type branched-subunit amino acid transport system substrate-binding protein